MVDSPRINVRPTPSQLEIYKGASWAQPATDMIEDTLLRGFEDSGRIRGVARTPHPRRLSCPPMCAASNRITRARPRTVVIEVNAKLIHVADQRVVADRTFRQAQPVGSTDVPAVTAAFERGLQQLAQDVVGWTLQSGQADQPTVAR